MLRRTALLALSLTALADWFEDDSLGSDEPATKDPLLAFSGADLEDFEATLVRASTSGCEMWHAELRGNSTTDENALPCLVDAACAAKYSALADACSGRRATRARRAQAASAASARGCSGRSARRSARRSSSAG